MRHYIDLQENKSCKTKKMAKAIFLFFKNI